MKKEGRSKILALLLVCIMLMSTLYGCSSGSNGDDSTDTNASQETPAPDESGTDDTDGADDETTDDTTAAATGETTVIRWGTHWQAGIDPHYVDEATGEYTLAEAERQAALAAEEAIKEAYNVEIEYVQYSGDTRSDLVTSVLSNNPICDIALIWGGAESTILAQNILQPLDDYSNLFDGDENSWMFMDQVYGHNYFLSSSQAFYQKWPLVYNITLLEQVDALKDDDGNTIYPTDLFLDGEWTWSTFEDYLTKIQAHFANVQAADGAAYTNVQAYETDYRFAGLSAVYSAGGAIYDENGLGVNSDETISGIQYITGLIDSGLLTDPGTYDDGYVPVWCKGGDDFNLGATVFTDIPGWYMAGAGSALSERGESMGMVPYPRPDDMDMEDENYRQVLTAGDTFGVLKGVDEETTQLALESFVLYWNTYYETYGGVESVTEYKDTMASSIAASVGIDIFNEECGDDLLEVFKWNADKIYSNDFADLLGVRVTWDDIFGKGLYGIGGMAAYEVAIEANLNEFTNVIENMESILSSEEIRDNIAPEITEVETAAFPVGTDPSSIDWTLYVSAADAVDGDLDLATATIDYSTADFDTIGLYENALSVAISDSSENEATKTMKIVIYDPDSTEAPTLAAKEELPTVAVGADASAIDWTTYIDSAVDSMGVDLSSLVTADISYLDVTTAGEYEVTLSVTDYSGNTTEETITVVVE